MSVLATFSAVTGTLKAAGETVKTMIDLHDAAIFRAKAIELQQQISSALADSISAYESQAAALQRVQELEKEVTNLKAWDADKQRYELKELGTQGIFAYTLKAEAQGTEPIHSICPDCYQQGIKSIVQQVTRFPGRTDVRICQRCGWEVYAMGAWDPAHGGTKSSSRRSR